MRKYIDKKLSEENNKDTYFLVADMGNFPKIKEAFGTRFINCGCREVHMLNLALGLALAGKHVFIYSVAGFVIHKAYDVIREIRGILPETEGSITIYNAGAGFVYSEAGEGHYLLDDISLMENFSSIFMPASIKDLDYAIEEGKNHGTFSYIRGGYDNAPQEKTVIKNDYDLIVTTGTMFSYLERIIRKNNLDVGLEILGESYPNCNLNEVIVIEDHQQVGGIASILKTGGFSVKAHLFTPSRVTYVAKTPQPILDQIGFSENEIVYFISEAINE